MSVALASRGVSITRGGRAILDDITAAIPSGALTAIVGPNGSGKSTLLRVLAGLWRPSRGSVSLEGAPLERMARREIARRMAFLPQDTRCDFAFTVTELVAMGRHPHRGRFESEQDRDRRAIESAIVVCGLRHLRTRTVDRLSGGERRRVAIARCLAAEPHVVLLDEPTAHLDLEHALTVLELCRALAESGCAVVVATHDLSAISRAAKQVIVLSQGRIVANGSPDEVLTAQICRDVFAVEAEIVSTSSGQPAFVFTKHARDPRGLASAL